MVASKEKRTRKCSILSAKVLQKNRKETQEPKNFSRKLSTYFRIRRDVMPESHTYRTRLHKYAYISTYSLINLLKMNS